MSQPKCRILCIDDHEDASEMMRLILSQEEYEVVIAETIQEALQVASASEFDLYVLDRHLPDGSGLELCKQLTKITPGVPCIFYSGDAYDIHRSEALAAGARSRSERASPRQPIVSGAAPKVRAVPPSILRLSRRSMFMCGSHPLSSGALPARTRPQPRGRR